MFENRPQSPTNKLQLYFNGSSFLNQQEEIAIFIKDFPIIKLNQIPSINNLIGLLIKQNSLLADKYQSQVNLLREAYSKHQILLKNTKQSKAENKRLQQQLMSLKVEISSKQNKLNQLTIGKDNTMKQYQELVTQVKNINANFEELKGILSFMIRRQYKNCEKICKNMKLNDKFINNLELQSYFKEQRKKEKTFKNIQKSTRQFCQRLNQIVQVVPANILATELGHQISGFYNILNQIGQQKIRQNNKSPNIGSSMSKSSIRGSFENLLTKAIEVSQTSCKKQEISLQLEEVKRQFISSRNFYQEKVKQLKKQYESDRITKEEIIHSKEEALAFYQSQMRQLKTKYDQCFQENQRLLNELRTLKMNLEENECECQNLQRQIQKLKEELKDLYEIKQKSKQQLIKIWEMQVNSRDIIIAQKEEKRKKQKQEFQQQIRDYKKKLKEIEAYRDICNGENREKLRKLQDYEQLIKRKQDQISGLKNKISLNDRQIQNLKHQNAKKTKEIELNKGQIKESDHQKSLQGSYILELQKKIKQFQKKIQANQAKKLNESSWKKQNSSLKNNLAAEKKHSLTLEEVAQQQKQQNQRMKAMLNQMKKELQQVYVRIHNLREIQEDRERLIQQNTKYKKQLQQLFRDYQKIKMEVLRVESENRGISLQLKHYKSVISRIQGLS